MKRKSLKKLWSIAMGTVGAIFAICFAEIVSANGYNVLTAANTTTSYVCSDVTFGGTVGNPSSSTNLTSKTNLNKVCTSTVIAPETNFTLTDWTNSNYQNKAKDGTYYAVKIGGSKTGKYSGSFTLNLIGYTCERAIIYASGWAGDNNTALSINSSKEQAITATGKGETCVFAAYTFENINSSILTFKNKTDMTSNCRILISKIVLRVKTITQ